MNLDYLSSEEFDLMTEDELNNYLKLKQMKEENQIDEQNVNPFPEENPHFGCFEKIWSSEYDAELDMVMLEVMLCNGDMININLKSHHIKELSLFLHKEQAAQKYIDFVLKK